MKFNNFHVGTFCSVLVPADLIKNPKNKKARVKTISHFKQNPSREDTQTVDFFKTLKIDGENYHLFSYAVSEQRAGDYAKSILLNKENMLNTDILDVEVI